MVTISCPKCGTENLVDAMNCKECRINLEWAKENLEEVNAIKQSQQVQELIQESTLYFEENIIFGFSKEGIIRILGEMYNNIYRLSLLLIFIGILGAIINYEKSFINPFGIPFPLFCIITGGILFGVMTVISLAGTIFYYLFFFRE